MPRRHDPDADRALRDIARRRQPPDVNRGRLARGRALADAAIAAVRAGDPIPDPTPPTAPLPNPGDDPDLVWRTCAGPDCYRAAWGRRGATCARCTPTAPVPGAPA